MRAARSSRASDARLSPELALVRGQRGEPGGVRPVLSCPLASGLCGSERVSVPSKGTQTQCCYAAAGFSGSAPRGVPALRGVFARRRWPSAQGSPEPGARTGARPARAVHTPCNLPTVHTRTCAGRGLEAHCALLAAASGPPPLLSDSPGSAPLRAKQSRLRNSPPGEACSCSSHTPPCRAHCLPTRRPWTPATTHPAIPSWLSVARRGPPFFGSSSVYIIIRGGLGPVKSPLLSFSSSHEKILKAPIFLRFYGKVVEGASSSPPPPTPCCSGKSVML